MENQIILATRLGSGVGYFSVWTFGKRIPGSYDPYTCLKMYRKGIPHKNEILDEFDIPILLEPLVKWSE